MTTVTTEEVIQEVIKQSNHFREQNQKPSVVIFDYVTYLVLDRPYVVWGLTVAVDREATQPIRVLPGQ